MLPAARITDMHVCTMVTPGTPPVPHFGGPIFCPCSSTVIINGLYAARATDLAMCVAPVPDIIATGSSSVFIEGLPAARVGDLTIHGGVIVSGAQSVVIGG